MMTLQANLMLKTKKRNWLLSLLSVIRDQELPQMPAQLKAKLPKNNPKRMRNKRPLLPRKLNQVMILQMTQMKILKRKPRLLKSQRPPLLPKKLTQRRRQRAVMNLAMMTIQKQKLKFNQRKVLPQPRKMLPRRRKNLHQRSQVMKMLL